MKVLAITLLLITSIQVSAQFFSNPSFEGYTGAGISPSGWSPCNLYSSPDTQPGCWNVNTAASDKNTYVSLITRDHQGPYAYNNEAIQTTLQKNLKSGNCYALSVALAKSPDFGFDNWGTWIDYTNPVQLKIWGGNSSCDKAELLWTSPTITNVNWQTFSLTFLPLGNYNNLILEAACTSAPGYRGNVLVDNITLSEFVSKSVVAMDTFVKKGSTVTLDCSAGDSYKWTPPAGLSCANCQHPSAVINVPETYTVTISNAQGCSSTETFHIKPEVLAFNLITPNNDGYNDLFEFEALPENCRLEIYNRWGDLIYKSSSYQNNWDGRDLHGNPVVDGTYYYVLKVYVYKQTKSGYLEVHR